MSDIPPELLGKLYTTLSNCGPFTNDNALRATFVDARISAWHNKLPDANNPDERIKLTIDFLLSQQNATGENALFLFLNVLSEQIDPSDACHHALTEIAVDLKRQLELPSPNPPIPDRLQKNKFHILLSSLRGNRKLLAGLGALGTILISIAIISNIRTPVKMPSSPTTPEATFTVSDQPPVYPATHIPTLTSTPVPTATPSPTWTPTPVSSPTPTFAPIEGFYRISIAKFKPVDMQEMAIAQRLEQDLLDKLDEYGLAENVSVEIQAEPFESNADAQNFLDNGNTDVLIWGWYDQLDIKLNILLRDQPQTKLYATNELPLVIGEKPEELTFIVREALPQNTTFLSLFIIGHLYHASNHYQEGYQAFDAAMNNMPETVALENEGLVHFFKARSMQAARDPDIPIKDIACEYLAAIESDPDMVEAYNNLAVLLMNWGYPFDIRSACGFEVTLESIYPRDLIDDAIQINPEWGLAQYNKAALNWQALIQGYEMNGSTAIIQTAKEAFEDVIALDPSIAGAYIALGNLAVYENESWLAMQYFAKAHELWPASPEVAFNLGQAYALAGREDAAIEAYQRALSLTVEDSEVYRAAHFALGNIYHHRMTEESLDNSYREYQWAQVDPTCGHDDRFEEALSLALVKYAIDTGDWISATQRLEGCTSPPLGGYLLWLTYRIQNDSRADDWATRISYGLADPFWAWTAGDINAMTWEDIGRQCLQGRGLVAWDATTWGSAENPCLPENLKSRLEYVYAQFQHRVQCLLFYNNEAIPGMRGACPYVFTFDEKTRAWTYDTTIIYKLVGPEMERSQVRPLQRFDGRLWVRELEPETSYIDQLYVRVLTTEGHWYTLRPNNAPDLMANDHMYLVLHAYDQQVLTFDTLPDTAIVEKAWVVAEGYYVPYDEALDVELP